MREIVLLWVSAGFGFLVGYVAGKRKERQDWQILIKAYEDAVKEGYLQRMPDGSLRFTNKMKNCNEKE